MIDSFGQMMYRREMVALTVAVGGYTLSGCLSTLTDEGNPESAGGSQSREIVTTYDEALVARNDATTTRDTGVNQFNERNYADAVEPLETARSGYEEAEDGFADAASLAAEIDETAADLCETAVDETALQADATDAALSAARAARNDADAETINGHTERFRSLREDAAAIDVADADAVASALALD